MLYLANKKSNFRSLSLSNERLVFLMQTNWSKLKLKCLIGDFEKKVNPVIVDIKKAVRYDCNKLDLYKC